ncbi:hypothetical protein [uncultured Roseobacter sp.]|nr:hypothetical protein [uncultured Roseobacter sp.]
MLLAVHPTGRQKVQAVHRIALLEHDRSGLDPPQPTLGSDD